jgi:hypothetical protein
MQLINVRTHTSTITSLTQVQRSNFDATQTGKFAAWRAQAQAQTQESAKARIEALRIAKQEAILAATATEAAKRQADGQISPRVSVK